MTQRPSDAQVSAAMDKTDREEGGVVRHLDLIDSEYSAGFKEECEAFFVENPSPYFTHRHMQDGAKLSLNFAFDRNNAGKMMMIFKVEILIENPDGRAYYPSQDLADDVLKTIIDRYEGFAFILADNTISGIRPKHLRL